MKPALVDTNILSLFFRNHPLVVEKFDAYIKEYDKIKYIQGSDRTEAIIAGEEPIDEFWTNNPRIIASLNTAKSALHYPHVASRT